MKAPHDVKIYGRNVKAGEDVRLRPYPWPPKADKKGAVLAFLESVIDRESEVLEFGSGGSTIWFARHAKTVLAFEKDSFFWKLANSEISRRRLSKRAKIVLAPNYPKKGFRLTRKQYDFILNDGSNRVACAKVVFRLLKPGGYVMCTDTNKSAAQIERNIYRSHNFKYIAVLPGSRAAWRKPG